MGAEDSSLTAVSLHADILNARHTSGGLAAIMPMDEFVSSPEIPPPDEAGGVMEWRPWNTVHFDPTPTFLRNAERKQIAVQMIKIFKVPNVEEFRRRILKRAPSDGHATRNGATRYRKFAMVSGEMRLEEGWLTRGDQVRTRFG
jgi:hypothetical protein